VKERPIILSTEMVRASLEGRKTMTRRPLKPQPKYKPFQVNGDKSQNWYNENREYPKHGNMMSHTWKCPYGEPGDRLFWTMAAPSWAGQTPEERFWARVYKTNTCWEWLGQVSGHAKHGRFKIGQMEISTHRYSWIIHHGNPGSMKVLHKCDVGWCVNPAHLYLGTDKDNRKDQSERDRIRYLHGDDNPASKITRKEADKIRQLYNDGIRQKDLAQKYNIHQCQVSRIVNNLRQVGQTSTELPLLGSRWLEITGVRVERLQEIMEEDAQKEGILFKVPARLKTGGGYRRTFEALWDSLYTKKPEYQWEKNPWVFVISFKRVAQ